MQVYFIDNEDYFHRKALFRDKNGKFFEDNDERMIFFARGVIETVKKLGWPPDIIHCHGWFTSLLPLYIKTAFKDNPLFSDSKVVFSVYDNAFEESIDPNMIKKLKYDKIKDNELKNFKDANYNGLIKGAMDYSDAIIMGSENLNPELVDYAGTLKVPLLSYKDEETYIEAYNDFYNELLKDMED
jgi:starch synthase